MITIGLLAEPAFEKRVSLTPESVKALIGMGHKVLFESGAGLNAFLPDELYLAQQAQLANRSEIIAQSNILCRITPLSVEDLGLAKPSTILMGVFQPLVKRAEIESLAAKGFTIFSMDAIPRITRAQSMDVLSSMSTVSGYKAVLTAALHLPRFFPMLMTAAGTIAPAKVLILGAGVAGLQAIATARRLGAVVEAFDTRLSTKEQVESLGGKFVQVEGAVEDKTAGGYAVEQSDDFKKRQAEAIHKHAIKSDVIITTALIPGKAAPKLLHAETVAAMKPGSVIVDLAAVNGGNTHGCCDGQTIITQNGVKIIGDSALQNLMPQDASTMYSKNMLTFLKLFVSKEGIQLNFSDEVIRGTCMATDGKTTFGK